MKKERYYPERQCEISQCTNLVEPDYNIIDKTERTFRSRYCVECAEYLQLELTRKKWREELGIG